MKKIIAYILRKIGFIFIRPHDDPFITSLKQQYEHSERVSYYGRMPFMVDCLYCHAVPGTIETVLLELRALRKIFRKTQPSLLNLGGGIGQVSRLLGETDFLVYNVDIELDREDEQNKRFDLNSTKPFPFGNKKFQVVVCEEIIEHIEDPWKLFRTAFDALENGGYLILTTPNVLSSRDRAFFKRTGYFRWFVPKFFDFHVNPVFFWELDLIGKKTGFTLEKVLGSGSYYFSRNKKETIKKILCKNEGIILVFKK